MIVNSQSQRQRQRHLQADSSSSSMISLEDHTADSLRYWDTLRASPPQENFSNATTTAELHEDSNVIRVSFTDNDNDKDIRLCHLTSMLPSTSDDQGTLQPDYGLYTEGAGLLALLHFNQRDTSIVQDLSRLRSCNVQLTMDFANTQFSPMQACRVLSEDIVPIDRPHSLAHPYPISLVGATRSAVTGPLAILASVYELPVVSYGSTSSQLNSLGYFGRTVPTNQGDAIAAAQYFRQVLKVTHMGVLFVQDGFGSAFHKEFAQAAKNTLDPPMTLWNVPYNPDDGEEGIRRAMQQLYDSGYQFFYGIISTPTYNTVMRQAYDVGLAGHPGYTWILSGDSGQVLGADYSYDAATEADLAAATNGVGVISLNIEHNPAFDAAWSMLEGNRAIKEYFVDKHAPELDFGAFEFYDSPTFWEYLQYDAVMALGFAACEASQDFFTGSELFDSMMNTLFRGASGHVEFDPKTGTRETASLSYKITNVVARQPDKDGRIYFDTADTKMQEPTLNNTWIDIHGAPAYVYADGTTIAPPGLPDLEENQNLIGTGILVAGLCIGILSILLSLGCAAWVWWSRNSQVVQMSQPFFLLLICLGTFLMACAIVPMSFQEPMSQSVLDAGCVMVPWFFSTGFSIAFSALFSKTMRIYRLMKGGRTLRRVTVTVQDVLRPLVGLASLNIILLTAWTIVAPLRWTRVEMKNYDEYGRNTDSYGSCQSTNKTLQNAFVLSLLGVDLVALISANIVNYKARGISKTLHEASSIALSMAILLEAVLIGSPAMLVVDSNPPASFLIRSILVSIICGGILLPMFHPKWHDHALQQDNPPPTGSVRRASTLPAFLIKDSQEHGSVAAIRSHALRSSMSRASKTGTGNSARSLRFSEAPLDGSGISARSRRFSEAPLDGSARSMRFSEARMGGGGGGGGGGSARSVGGLPALSTTAEESSTPLTGPGSTTLSDIGISEQRVDVAVRGAMVVEIDKGAAETVGTLPCQPLTIGSSSVEESKSPDDDNTSAPFLMQMPTSTDSGNNIVGEPDSWTASEEEGDELINDESFVDEAVAKD